VLTAFGSPAIEREARRRGARAVLAKPQSLPHLAHIADELLGAQP
jgi:CheY-like chemotaxis protein